jgi:hypothetical protein
MKDGVVIFVVCLVLIGCVGWLVLRANGLHPFAANKVAVQPQDEIFKENPEPVSTLEKAPVVTKVNFEDGDAAPVVIARKALNIPRETLLPPREAPLKIENASAVLKPPAPAPAAPAPFPSTPQIKPGSEKSHITQMYGNPALSATTGDHGHTFDTFVYNRDRGEAVTIIRFRDGKVSSARTTP